MHVAFSALSLTMLAVLCFGRVPGIRFGLLLAGFSCLSVAVRAEVAVIDATGATVRLAAPARRIVSLAPHITELVYAAGAGDKLVGNVDFGEYPPAAHAVSKVGGYDRLDMEAIVGLKPDLLLAWQGGNMPAAIAKLKALGFTVYLSEPGRIEDVATELERIGRLAGTQSVADAAAAAFRQRYQRLRERYGGRPVVDVFYQVWKDPLMTVNGRQVISDAIALCGGRNIFAELPVLAPTVSVEAVIARRPEAIVVSGMGDERPEWLDDWRRWRTIPAVARGNLYFVPPQTIQRYTPRVLDGIERLCQSLEDARGKRPKNK